VVSVIQCQAIALLTFFLKYMNWKSLMLFSTVFLINSVFAHVGYFSVRTNLLEEFHFLSPFLIPGLASLLTVALGVTILILIKDAQRESVDTDKI